MARKKKKKEKIYKQCILEQDGKKHVSWIDARGAIEGKVVEVLDMNKELWKVVKVWSHELKESEIKRFHHFLKDHRKATDI